MKAEREVPEVIKIYGFLVEPQGFRPGWEWKKQACWSEDHFWKKLERNWALPQRKETAAAGGEKAFLLIAIIFLIRINYSLERANCCPIWSVHIRMVVVVVRAVMKETQTWETEL